MLGSTWDSEEALKKRGMSQLLEKFSNGYYIWRNVQSVKIMLILGMLVRAGLEAAARRGPIFLLRSEYIDFC